jgi:hypothetical protein
MFRKSDGTLMKTMPYVKGLEVRTSNMSKIFSVGNLTSRANTQSIITAPRGYRVIGFYGTSWEEYTSVATRLGEIILQLGLIIAPL